MIDKIKEIIKRVAPNLYELFPEDLDELVREIHEAEVEAFLAMGGEDGLLPPKRMREIVQDNQTKYRGELAIAEACIQIRNEQQALTKSLESQDDKEEVEERTKIAKSNAIGMGLMSADEPQIDMELIPNEMLNVLGYISFTPSFLDELRRIVRAAVKKVMDRLLEFECKDCAEECSLRSTPGFVHLMIPVKVVAKYKQVLATPQGVEEEDQIIKEEQ